MREKINKKEKKRKNYLSQLTFFVLLFEELCLNNWILSFGIKKRRAETTNWHFCSSTETSFYLKA